jgi:hypothetical protein
MLITGVRDVTVGYTASDYLVVALFCIKRHAVKGKKLGI